MTSIGKKAFEGCYDLVRIHTTQEVYDLAVPQMPRVDGHANVINHEFIPWDGVDPFGSDEPGQVTISGIVTYPDHTPAKDVWVLVSDSEGNNNFRYLEYTDKEGTWSMTLPGGVDYNINYRLDGYTVSGNIEKFRSSEGLELSAVAQLSGNLNNGIQFSMRQDGSEVNTIKVGTSVELEVTAPESATMVRLIVDGISYESYHLDENNHSVIFSRLFSSYGSGNRVIQFQIRENSEWTDVSTVKTLSMTKMGNAYRSGDTKNQQSSCGYTADFEVDCGSECKGVLCLCIL